MAFPNKYLYDPEFHKKPIEERIALLSSADAEFRAFPRNRQVGILQRAAARYGGQTGSDRISALIKNRSFAVIVGMVALIGSELFGLFRRRQRPNPQGPEGNHEPTAAAANARTRIIGRRAINREQAFIVWVAASLVLLEIAYPATVLLVWNHGGYWKQLPSRSVVELARDENHRWANTIGERKSIVAFEQWEDAHSDAEFKEWPDFRRMVTEVSITLLICGGLSVAIRRVGRNVTHSEG